MRAMILVGLLVLVATVAAAQEAEKPVTDKPKAVTEHHFRYEIGIEKPRTVTGWFEETDGKVRTVALDLDEDGKYERTKLPVAPVPPGADIPEFIEVKFSVTHEDCDWGLQYYDMYQYLPEEQRDPDARFHFTWTVTKGKDVVVFSGATAKFHPTAEAASAVRIGAGFKFEVTADTQGPKGLVSIAVKDASGCGLSHVMRGGKPSPPTFTLKQGKDHVLAETAPFG